MNIGIDIRSTLKTMTGIGYYTINLLSHLSGIDRENKYYLYSKVGLFNRDKKLTALPGDNFKHIVNRFNRDPVTVLKNLDIFHTSAFDLPKPRGAKLIIVVHGIIHKAYPASGARDANERKENNLKRILPQADRIIACSQNTRKDLLRFYDADESKIRLVYPGVSHDLLYSKGAVTGNEAKILEDNYGINGKFILYVGTLEPRKNVDGLIRAYKILKDDYGIEHKLVVSGMKGGLYEKAVAVAAELDLSKNVIFTGYVNRDRLQMLYERADVFVYPSFYEGVGLPVLEAFAFNVPVVTSASSSLGEIAGDAAVLIDPASPGSIAEGILKITRDESFRKELIKRGSARVKEFSWEDAARKTLDVFKECADLR